MANLHGISESFQKFTFNKIFPLIVLFINIIIITLSLNYFKPEKYFAQTFVYGKILSVDEENLEDDPYIPGQKVGKQQLTVEITSGTETGNIYKISNTLSKGHNILAKEGSKYVFTIREESKGKKVVWLYSYNRIPWLAFFLGLFVLLVVIIAGKQGIKSLIGLSFTGVMLLFVLVPFILKGSDPISLAIVVLSLVTCVSFLLISGFTKKSLVAIAGTIGGIVIAGLISYIASKLAHLSGIHMEKGEQILYIAEDHGIRINGFLFISILIASSGAVMDVAMSLTSSLEELKKHNPNLPAKSLFKSGMTIGKDLIGTMINTLILAFTGSSFTLILMIVGLSMGAMQFLNIPLISIEIIQALGGSIGIILTVPLTNIFFIIIKKENENEKEII